MSLQFLVLSIHTDLLIQFIILFTEISDWATAHVFMEILGEQQPYTYNPIEHNIMQDIQSKIVGGIGRSQF